MKIAKSAMLGSAACLIAMGGVEAADLPVKAKAVEYVRICSLYGVGYYYIPGTDTCIKLGGYLRADVTFNGNGVQGTPAWSANGGQQSRLRNYYFARARQDLNIDTRTATEYGLVRTYFDATFNWTTGSFSASTPSVYSGDGIADGSVGVYFAFIQFAGFTLGKAVSQFDTPWTGYPANIGDALIGGHADVTGVNQFTYTANFAPGITGSISLQDPVAYYQTNLWNVSGLTGAGFAAGAYGGNSFGGTAAPDIVGMLRVDQAWGVFQASIAAHNNHSSYYDVATETSGHPNDKWGWAGQLGLSIRNVPTGPGDIINLSVGYADGASRYVWQSLVTPSFAMYGGTAIAGVYQSLGIAGVSDGVFATGTGIETTKLWGLRGGYTHNWDAHWSSAVFGTYTSVSYNATAQSYICAAVAAFLTPGSVCNPNFNVGQIGGNTRWTPVKNLTFTGEVMYTLLDQQYAGVAVLPEVGTKPATLYELRDQGTWTFYVRAQRNW